MTPVTCAIIENEGKILIARRAEGQNLAGKWEFPGGKLMNLDYVHQAGCMRSVRPGVGVEPSGFTPDGGGVTPAA